MIKNIVFALMLISSIHTIGFTNSSVLLDYGQCLNVTENDSWIEICSKNISQWNINKTLGFGETISNSTLNISITAPAFPTINLVKVMNYSEVFSLPNYSLVVVGPAPSATCPFVNASLSGGQNFTSSNANVTCTNSKTNVDSTLSFGDVYNDTTNNIVVRAPKFPSLNIKRVIYPGEFLSSFSTDDRYNYSILCNSSVINPDMQASIITCNSQLVSLTSSISSTNTTLSICQQKQVELEGKIQTLNQNLTQQSPQLKLNINCSAPAQIICPDTLQTYCTAEERASGTYVSCMERVYNSSATQLSSCQNSLAATQLSDAQCKSGQKQVEDLQSNIIVFICVIAVVGGLIYFLVDSAKKKRIEEGG